MIDGSFDGTDLRVAASLAERGAQALPVLERQVNLEGAKLQSHIVANKLQGQVLRHRSGKLAGSIRIILAKRDGDSIEGGVQGGGGPAWYGRIHEYGGIFAYLRKNKARAFGTHVIARFPQRSFMRTSLADRSAAIVAGMQSAMSKLAEGQKSV